jgi:hypothetical protein
MNLRAKGEVFQGIDDLDRMIYVIIEILKINMGNGIYERANLYFQKIRNSIEVYYFYQIL